MFKIKKKLKNKLGRVGEFITPNGIIETPAFIVVGTKAAVKSLSPEQVGNLGAQAVLGNTYHLYLQPGDDIIKKAGGLNKFMNWNSPTFTDSGGFQVFSLGAGFGSSENKFEFQKNISNRFLNISDKVQSVHAKLVKINEDGVEFRSCIDGSRHFFTPEKSIEIQNNIGADIIFAFDECVSPSAEYNYQKEATERTHRWAKRSLNCNNNHRLEVQLSSGNKQALFGIVQGGRFQDLREESARVIGAMDFDGFGIGGSFNKEDMGTAVGWVNKILPEDKPRHLLGIGNPEDIKEAVKNGARQMAKIFVERYGSYSTDNDYQNIEEVKSLCSQSLWSEISKTMDSVQSGSFVGVTTQVLSSSFTNWDASASASVELRTKRTEEKNGVTKSFYQDATVELVKTSSGWLVDELKWGTQNL